MVTDGSAVLGLGNIGPGAALPVMEGKAALFKRFADIDAWPICLDTQDTDEIVAVVQRHRARLRRHQPRGHLAPRAASRSKRGCATILDIPVFHDDQHGTAIVVSAALANALRCVDKPLADARIVDRRRRRGRHRDRVAARRGRRAQHPRLGPRGHPLPDRRARSARRSKRLAELTNPQCVTGDLHDALRGADVFIGVSAPGVLPAEWIEDMAPSPVVFALANPDPEVDVDAAQQRAAVRGDRAQRLPEPDQQRARVPGRLPRPARRAGQGGARPRCCCRPPGALAALRLGRAAQRHLHRAVGVRPARCAPAVAAAVREAADGAPTRGLHATGRVSAHVRPGTGTSAAAAARKRSFSSGGADRHAGAGAGEGPDDDAALLAGGRPLGGAHRRAAARRSSPALGGTS